MSSLSFYREARAYRMTKKEKRVYEYMCIPLQVNLSHRTPYSRQRIDEQINMLRQYKISIYLAKGA